MVLLFSFITIFYLIAWVFQSYFLLNCDVSWDMRITTRFLAGGKYVKDFFDTNPPLIFLLYYSPVALSKFFHINSIIAFRLYLLLMSSLSLYVCYFLIRKLFSKYNTLLAYSFFTVIVLSFLFLPLIEFGEREHLMLILTMPYFLLISYQLQENKTINLYARIGIGFFAGVGFAIKPYFIIVPILLELYYLFKTHKILAWMRWETLPIFVFMVVYLTCILIFFPEYMSTIVPMGMMFYYQGFGYPWNLVILQPVVFFCVFALLFHLIQYKANPYKILTSVLVIAAMGFLLSYLIQRTPWYYHALPVYTLAGLILVVLIGASFSNSYNPTLQFIFIAVSLILPIYNVQHIYPYVSTYNQSHVEIVDFFQSHVGHKSVYFISATPNELLSAIDYTDVIYNSRFQHLVWIPGAVKQTLSQQQIDIENSFINMVSEDLINQKPDYIFVDANENKRFFLHPFDYLTYFSSHPKFKSIWNKYHYQTTIESHLLKLGNVEHWNLYLFANENEFNPEHTEGNAIVLIGTNNLRTVHFVINKKMVEFIYKKLPLSNHELKWVFAQKKSGLIIKELENHTLIDQILNESLYFTPYKYQVYARTL